MWIIAALLIGKLFFDLAKKNGKPPAAFVVVGILTYTIAEWILGLIVRFVLAEYYYNWWLGWVSIPFSLFATWVLYTYLKSSWQPKTRSKHKQRYDNPVAKNPVTVSKDSASNASTASKVNLGKPSHAEPPRSMSSQSTGRYNKNER